MGTADAGNKGEDVVENAKIPLLVSLLAGGAAGLATDVSLFPLDTIKTRLQSSQGFLKAGGFRGMYSGLSATAVGSAPNAALFFATYDSVNRYLIQNHSSDVPLPVSHMIAASCGEVMACLIRVPTEVVKQRLQAGNETKFRSAMYNCYHKEGIMGFYRGFSITIFREVPFSLFQFPMYEYLKSQIRLQRSDGQVPAAYAAVCGSITGAISAALTTPMDVIKTRIMLGSDKHGVEYHGVRNCFQRVVAGE
jgi:solute carrier family 25 (mitochondrial S-adenosylmethionine transporter), member 26